MFLESIPIGSCHEQARATRQFRHVRYGLHLPCTLKVGRTRTAFTHKTAAVTSTTFSVQGLRTACLTALVCAPCFATSAQCSAAIDASRYTSSENGSDGFCAGGMVWLTLEEYTTLKHDQTISKTRSALLEMEVSFFKNKMASFEDVITECDAIWAAQFKVPDCRPLPQLTCCSVACFTPLATWLDSHAVPSVTCLVTQQHLVLAHTTARYSLQHTCPAVTHGPVAGIV